MYGYESDFGYQRLSSIEISLLERKRRTYTPSADVFVVRDRKMARLNFRPSSVLGVSYGLNLSSLFQNVKTLQHFTALFFLMQFSLASSIQKKLDGKLRSDVFYE
jgi:hypothetical protein